MRGNGIEYGTAVGAGNAQLNLWRTWNATCELGIDALEQGSDTRIGFDRVARYAQPVALGQDRIRRLGGGNIDRAPK
ncbi:MAG TPA: hypothetical protein DDX04_08040 [Massilia sp.]|nr:hypothetical protein [Massilia sp.]